LAEITIVNRDLLTTGLFVIFILIDALISLLLVRKNEGKRLVMTLKGEQEA